MLRKSSQKSESGDTRPYLYLKRDRLALVTVLTEGILVLRSGDWGEAVEIQQLSPELTQRMQLNWREGLKVKFTPSSQLPP